MSTTMMSSSSAASMVFAAMLWPEGLHLGSKGGVRGSVRWSKAWQSYGCKESSNGAATVVRELSGDGAVLGFAWRARER